MSRMSEMTAEEFKDKLMADMKDKALLFSEWKDMKDKALLTAGCMVLLKRILTYESPVYKITDRERVSESIKAMKDIYEKMGWEWKEN